jgi:hypothetical protein
MSGGTVSAEELVRALDRNQSTLPAEIATFVVLEGCESLRKAGPRELVSLADVRISEHGVVTLEGKSCDDEAAARSLHRALSKLLLAAGPNLPPALARLSELGPQGDEFSLRTLHDELEAALVPLNRLASRRVLARFAREAAYPAIDASDVDAALESLIGKGSAPDNDAPGKSAGTSEPHAPDDDHLFDGLDLGGEESHYLEAAARTSRDRVSEENLRAVRASVRPSFAPHPPTPSGRDRDSLRSLRALASDLPETDSSTSTSRKLFVGFALMALAIISVTITLSMRRPAPERSEQPAAQLEHALVREAGGDLSVHVSAPNAQVLRFVGRAPVTVKDLPVGVAHEFVATADGYRPSRVLVPASADWEATAEGARYELALQLTQAEGTGRDQSLELGPSRLDTQTSTPPTRLGSIRVVATPRGARVYQLVGFSPDVAVQDIPLTETQELLIYREGYVPVVRVLQESDFHERAGRRVAAIDVQLDKRP